MIIKDKRILIGYRHYRSREKEITSLWTCPGGRCNPGESIEKALRREVKEETGIDDLEIHNYIGEVSGAKKGDLVPLFLCGIKQKAKLMEPHKFSEWQWIDFKDYANGLPKNYINENARVMITNFLSEILR